MRKNRAAPVSLSKDMIAGSHIFAAFDRGQIPVISCVNNATLSLGAPFPELVSALQKFVDAHFAPVWGTKCYLSIEKTVKEGTWGMVFMDDPDVSDAFGYHFVTKDNLPLSKMFVKVSIKNNEPVSVTASHELAEMLVDPGVQLCAMDPKGVVYAYEVADADEMAHFPVDGIPMTNFQYPSWFEGFRKPRTTQFDHLKRIDRPFKIMPGGYMSIFKNGQWTNIFGSKSTAKKFDIKDHSRARLRATEKRLKVKG